jgi:hypothetical protein
MIPTTKNFPNEYCYFDEFDYLNLASDLILEILPLNPLTPPFWQNTAEKKKGGKDKAVSKN